MTDEKKKMTAQGSSVGADDGQSISQITENSIPLPGKKATMNCKLPGQSGRNVPQDTAHERPGLPAHCNPGRADGQCV
mgnify:CR=1 FL=1